MTVPPLLIVLLATVSAGGLAYALLYTRISGGARADQRQKAMVNPTDRRADRALVSGANRREQVAQSLKDLEKREKARNTISMQTRIEQAGLDWTLKRFLIVSAVVGVVTGALLYSISGMILVGVAGLFAGGFGVPRWMLNHRKKRRIARFLEELPNAMDVIVRGIRSGLPVGDCLRIIASEAQEPVRSEFRVIVEAQTLGIPVGEAVAKLYERVPVPEANFFAIVIGIQQKSGGNLSETIGNLSKVLRERKKMAGKIKAMSMEAKASAGIIACLPPAVATLTYLSSPRYIELLWLTQPGQIALCGCALWMTTGVFVMKKMINFDF